MHYGRGLRPANADPNNSVVTSGEIRWMLRRRRIYFGARSAMHQCRLHTKLLCHDTGREEEQARHDGKMLPVNGLHFTLDLPKLPFSVRNLRDLQALGGKR